MHHPPSIWMCSPIWKLSAPRTLEVFMEAASNRYGHYLSFQLLSPPQRVEGGVESSKLPILVWVSYDQSSPKIPPRVASLGKKKCSYYWGNSKELRSCVRKWGRGQIHISYCVTQGLVLFLFFLLNSPSLASSPYTQKSRLQSWGKGNLPVMELSVVLPDCSGGHPNLPMW